MENPVRFFAQRQTTVLCGFACFFRKISRPVVSCVIIKPLRGFIIYAYMRGDEGSMKNFNWCVYTYRHRKAFMYVAEKIIPDEALKKEILYRAEVHDVDKLLLYLFFDQKEVQDWHVLHQPHHLESGLGKSYVDLAETVIDYECAPYTKPDKPLNAYDFVHKLISLGYLTKEKAETLFGIMRSFGIDRSYDGTKDAAGMEYLRQFEEVTEEMILFEVFCYIHKYPESEAVEYLLKRWKKKSLHRQNLCYNNITS